MIPVRVELSRQETAGLDDWLAEEGGELPWMLLAATIQSLGGWSESRRLVVAVGGDSTERRCWGGAETAVGAFGARLAVVLEVERSIARTVRGVREQLHRSRRLATIWGLTLPTDLPVEIGFRWWQPGPLPSGWSCTPRVPDPRLRGSMLAIEGSRRDGALVVEWSFDAQRVSRSVVEALAAATLAGLRSLLAVEAATERSLADHFPDAELSAAELETLLAEL